MATAILSCNEFQTNTDDNNLEIFSLIWLNENVKDYDIQEREQKLRSTINHLRKFQDVKQCQQYIESRSKTDRLIIIVSGESGQEIVPLIHHLRQVISIHIYGINTKNNEQWTLKFTKVKNVINEMDELIDQIIKDYKIQEQVQEPLPINVYSTKTDRGKSTTGLNGQFVFYQILVDCLLRLKYTQTDKNEFINLLKVKYEGNASELNNLHEFEVKYSPDQALLWYTKETFLYKTLIDALRTQNIHMMFLLRDVISDIQHQLQYIQAENSLQVYRSQLISIDELNELKRNIGQFISINSFFSTSIDRKTALFLLGDTTSLIDLKLAGVLFEIDADLPMISTKPFANITEYSHFSDESEVLFMIGSIFRLKNIYYNDNDKVWIIEMTLCSDNEFDLKAVFSHIKRQTGNGKTNLQKLGKLLWEMGKLDLAEEYFKRFLNERPSNGYLLRTLYEDLGKIASQQGDYDMSMEWYQRSLQVKKPYISPNTEWNQTKITIAKGVRHTLSYGIIRCPFGLCSDSDQNIYIVDYLNHRIVEWKTNTTNDPVMIDIDRSEDSLDRSFYPKDVIIDKKNNSLIISDNLNRQVIGWSLESNTKTEEIIIKGICCYGLALDKDGYIYVADIQKHEVSRWKRGDLNGTTVAGGNGKGDKLDQLNVPTFIFVDEDYSLYVSDSENRRVVKWLKDAKEGIVVAGNRKDPKDSSAYLSNPQAVIVDELGHIYVADSSRQQVIRWGDGTEEGTVVIGRQTMGSTTRLKFPTHLSFDRVGNLYVVDSGENEIIKFEIRG